MNSSYAISTPVPVDADTLEIQQAKRAAIHQWYQGLQQKHLSPAAVPDIELVDDEVVRINGRVAITQSWMVWGRVTSAELVEPRISTGYDGADQAAARC